MKLTRDSALLWIGLIGSIAAFLLEHFGLLQQAFPAISAAWHARFELLSGLTAIVAAYLRMSPLALSPDHALADRGNADRTLTITGAPKGGA